MPTSKARYFEQFYVPKTIKSCRATFRREGPGTTKKSFHFIPKPYLLGCILQNNVNQHDLISFAKNIPALIK
jgi:hypothetical protein